MVSIKYKLLECFSLVGLGFAPVNVFYEKYEISCYIFLMSPNLLELFTSPVEDITNKLLSCTVYISPKTGNAVVTY